MNSDFLQPEEHVLSTLERDGSRRWLKPKLSCGSLWHRRRWVGYLLIAIFTIIPFIKVGGEPLVLLDIPARRFTILAFTFLPTDTVLLAVFMVGLLLTVFLFTALFGRVWCGWACPQTVYMEFVYRPVERLFEGTRGRGGKARRTSGAAVAAKYLVYLLISIYLANTFLAYFVGVDRLRIWVQQSPLEHPIPFVVMALVTGAMMFDFCYFREQLCLVACPYGRFQSVLLDQDSLIVAYDEHRGEPRGKKRKNAPDAAGALPVLGDCVDCGKCVTTCPTGIDIRDGLQMECINCTQCIDACNDVMRKLGRPENLIRYSSQHRDQGRTTGLLRARTLIYPVLLAAIATLFFAIFLNAKSFDAFLTREPGNPHSLTDTGEIRNVVKLKLTNRTSDPMTFTARVVEPAGAVLAVQESEMAVPGNQPVTFHLAVEAPRDAFRFGSARLELEIANQDGEMRTMYFNMVGPL